MLSPKLKGILIIIIISTMMDDTTINMKINKEIIIITITTLIATYLKDLSFLIISLQMKIGKTLIKEI